MRKAARDSERRKTEDLSARGRGRGRGKGRGRGRKRKAPDLANMDEPDQNPEMRELFEEDQDIRKKLLFEEEGSDVDARGQASSTRAQVVVSSSINLDILNLGGCKEAGEPNAGKSDPIRSAQLLPPADLLASTLACTCD